MSIRMDMALHRAGQLDFMEAVADHLEELGMSKADLARLVDKNPSTVRKLFLDG